MIYITGDTHADFSRFNTKNFPIQKQLTKNDYVIICGDFGGVWNYQFANAEESYWLEWLNRKPFTTLFVDGNHENYDRLKEFSQLNYHGGKAHKIRENIYHLMRGYIFDFEGKKFFTFGGASSHDIQDGILDIKDYDSFRDLIDDYNKRTHKGEMLRINHISWWKDELPTSAEMKRGIENLKKVNFEVDYVITHCLPQSIINVLYPNDSDKLTRYFDNIVLDYKLKFKKWHAGHYHINQTLCNKYEIHYKDIERIL